MTNKLFILDDHTAITKGIESQIQRDKLEVLCGNHLSELIRTLKTVKIDLLILDYELHEGTAIDLIPVIRKHQPGICIVIYTMHTEPWIISMLIKAEVNGIVIKGDRLDEIHTAIDKILFEKERYFSASALNTVLSIMGDQSAKRLSAYTPSPRELEVIDLLSKGLTSEEVSKKLFLSKNTVDTMRKNILLKSGALNVSHLMRIAFMKGWINA